MVQRAQVAHSQKLLVWSYMPVHLNMHIKLLVSLQLYNFSIVSAFEAVDWRCHKC